MSERWIDRAHVFGADAEEKKQLAEHYESIEVPDLVNAPELEKSESEKRGIEATLEALNEMFESYELPDFTYYENRIHVMDGPVFRQAHQDFCSDGPDPDGFWANGHVYLRREDSEARMLSFMTHELAHAASHFAINVWVDQADDSRRINTRKSGIVFHKETRDGQASSMFEGLNEAFTELLAHNIRRPVAEKYGLTEEGAEKLTSGMSYYPNILVLDRLFRELSGEERGSEEAFAKLLADYVSGKMKFLKDVESKLKGSVRILADMRANPVSALETAEKLGFEEEAAEIRGLMAEPAVTEDESR